MSASLKLVWFFANEPQADKPQQLLEQLTTLESVLFEDAWHDKAVKSVLGQFGVGVMLVVDDTALIGYCVFQIVFEMAEVLRIGTHPNRQNQGIGKMILNAFMKYCQQENVERILLEVRENNENAIAFYKKQGFYQIDKRKNYYQTINGLMDALILQKRVIN